MKYHVLAICSLALIGLQSASYAAAIKPGTYCGEIYGKVQPPNRGLRILMSPCPKGRRMMSPTKAKSATLDPKTGAFIFENVPKGTYAVWAEYDAGRLAASTFDVQVDKGKRNVGVLHVKPAAWVSGEVEPAVKDIDITMDDYHMLFGATKELGDFLIGGVPYGKHHFVFNSPDYCGSLDVDVEAFRKYQVPNVKLLKKGRITGKITTARTDLPLDQLLSLVTVFADEAGVEAPKDGSQTCPRDIDMKTGDYTIRSVPGRYNLSIIGPGILVIGVDDLPSDGPNPDVEKPAITTVIQAIAKAFCENDEQSIRSKSTPQCTYDGDPDAISILQNRVTQGIAWTGDRTPIVIRVNGDNAVVYTRAQQPLVDPKAADADPQAVAFKLDILERWKMKRTAGTWKLSKYASFPDLADALAHMQAYGMSPYAWVSPPSSPQIKIVVTDDPKLVNIGVGEGAVSAGHDWALEVR